MCQKINNINPLDPFAGVESDLDAMPDLEVNHPEKYEEWGNQAHYAKYEEECKDCRGSGRFVSWAGRDVGKCFKCDGKGKRFYKTSPEQREMQRERAKAKKAEKKAAQAQAAHDAAVAWAKDHEAEAKWLLENRESDRFAKSLSDSLQKWGSLTDGQLAAIRKNIERAESAKEREKDAPSVDMDGLMEGFNNALESGLKAPVLVVDNYRFSMAKANSRNAGHIYVTDDNPNWDDRAYFGKVSPEGKLLVSRNASDENIADILDISQNLLERAIAHGKMTGRCAMCSRELTDPKSVERGIGPICAGRWGF